MSDPESMSMSRVLAEYAPGDGGTWLQEFAWMALHSSRKLRGLALSIEEIGVQRPILLGDDGRVWDGHHRILIATDVGMEGVPVVHAQEVRDE